MPELSLLAALLAGLLGGVHCAGMCGGIVTAFSLQLPGAQPRPAFHLAANLGRIASYALAGAIAGIVGGGSLYLQQIFPVERALYLVAQLMLIALGLYLAGWWQGVLVLERAGGALWRKLQPAFSKLLPIRSVPGAFAAGMVWGWLPCGLVYSILITALASGSALHGGLTMLMFGLGTLPNLLAMGFFAERLKPWLQRAAVRIAAGVVLIAMGAVGLLRLWSS
jgi:uncharacterized protein